MSETPKAAPTNTLASAQAAVAATTGVKVGDRVRIVQTHNNDGWSRALIGAVGTLKNIVRDVEWVRTNYFVEVGGRVYRAAAVESAPSDPALGPYTVRLQAAKDAVAVIGDGASIEEITALAEWMLDVPPLKDVKFDLAVTSGLAYEAKDAKGGTAADITKAQLTVSAPITLRNLEFDLDDSVDSDVVEVSLDGISTYLADDDINELVDYLRAAQVVQAARRAASES